MPSIGLEIASRAIKQTNQDLTGPIRIFTGHLISFMANLVTGAPSSSDLPSNTLNLFLKSKDIICYVVNRDWQSGDSDSEDEAIEPSIDKPLLVFLHNASVNDESLRHLIATSSAGQGIYSSLFTGICKHRECDKEEDESSDEETDEVIDWFERLTLKLIVNEDAG
jgi:hypothetical protein